MNKNRGLIILNVVLAIALISLGVYVLWDHSSKEKDGNVGKKEPEEKEEKKEFVDKIDETRDWVYDANYTYTVSQTDFTANGKDFHVADIKVPYINIKGVEFKNINAQLHDVFNQAIAVFEQTAKGEPIKIDYCDYATYIYDNILSIQFLYSTGGADLPIPKYYTYNIDLKTGKILTYNEVREKLGYTSDENIKNSIKKYIEDAFPTDSTEETQTTTLQNYTNSVNDGSLPFYIDSNKKLNIAVKVALASSASGRERIITLQK